MVPRMIVVGGPPGSGKSTAFPVKSFGVDAFNIDDRCQELHGSYAGIPREVRARVSAECEQFIVDHIGASRSFAVETTMRTGIAIDQARAARAKGFTTLLFYLAAADASIHVERIRARAFGGGHAAPEGEIRATYVASLAMLREAVAIFDVVEIFDTTSHRSVPRLIASAQGGNVDFQDEPTPAWLKIALCATPNEPSP